MLETALSANYIPGSNMKGDVEGANWIFVLPNFEIEDIFCIGLPEISTLMAFLRFSKHVFVCVNRKEFDEIKKISHQNNLSNLHAIAVDSLEALPVSSDCADLVFVGDLKSFGNLDRAVLFREYRRLQNTHGFIYFETNKVNFLIPNPSNVDLNASIPSQRQSFWLTPFAGEAHTAVPLEDSKTRSYFLDNDLYTPSISLSSLKRMKRLFKKSDPGSTSLLPKTISSRKSSGDLPRKVLYFIQAIMDGVEWGLHSIEHSLIKHDEFISRTGVLIGEGVSELAQHPPMFLRSIASSSGVDLTHYRWGLSARGDYSSRKVLFYLFNRQNERSNDRKPEYIVKLVRDPGYNYRLENEYRALSSLNGYEEKIKRAIPEVAFWGYHNGLAILGETMIEGEPFRQKTNLTATCPHMQSAVNWLMELGIKTVNKSAGHAERVALALENLFNRFIEIYSIPAEHQSFLTNQIETIKNSRSPFPLVFQHGDPGTWNALATANGKVVFLDWEAAEPEGLPLWDLFYFFRSFSAGIARSNGIQDRIKGISQQLLAETPINRFLIQSMNHYCDRIGLAKEFVEPLFYTCWMHRSIKEATRLLPSNLGKGHYVRLLQFFIRHSSDHTLKRTLNPV